MNRWKTWFEPRSNWSVARVFAYIGLAAYFLWLHVMELLTGNWYALGIGLLIALAIVSLIEIILVYMRPEGEVSDPIEYIWRYHTKLYWAGMFGLFIGFAVSGARLRSHQLVDAFSDGALKLPCSALIVYEDTSAAYAFMDPDYTIIYEVDDEYMDDLLRSPPAWNEKGWVTGRDYSTWAMVFHAEEIGVPVNFKYIEGREKGGGSTWFVGVDDKRNLVHFSFSGM